MIKVTRGHKNRIYIFKISEDKILYHIHLVTISGIFYFAKSFIFLLYKIIAQWWSCFKWALKYNSSMQVCAIAPSSEDPLQERDTTKNYVYVDTIKKYLLLRECFMV